MAPLTSRQVAIGWAIILLDHIFPPLQRPWQSCVPQNWLLESTERRGDKRLTECVCQRHER